MNYKIIINSLILVLLADLASGQVSMGGKQSVEGTATILDFNSRTGNIKGVILPAVDDISKALSSDPASNNGTFLFNKSNQKVQVYENNVWKDLSDAGSTNDLVINTSDERSNGVVIGAASSSAKGVFILESSDKAMILPRISEPHKAVKSPYPGMMCFDTVSRTLAVFDGVRWNYWN
ncbi:hypothetical protein [Epilithonimonas hungarica]|uniref:Uncharacterized protein n=1 Tax=Epilithonimonas hungarica TaxID=454006 RepID=A0A1G7HVW4_9FLAO|nr:hypothetical protein [Epilithonimonas hungarica]SDF04687.1 hypothetical protein SAMN05421825_0918 [Epilithonimonas hungarica]